MKQQLVTVGLVVLLMISLGLIVRLAWTNHELKNRTDRLNSQLMAANLAVGKAETKFGDASRYITELEGSLKLEVEKWKGVLTRYVALEAKYRALRKYKGNAQVVYVEGPRIEVPVDNTFQRGMLYEAVTDKALLPVRVIERTVKDHRVKIWCEVKPKPNSQDKLPMTIGYEFHLKIRGQMVEKRLDDGAVVHFAKLWLVDDAGKTKETLPLQNFEVVVQDERKPKFYWWVPHLDAGVSIGVTNRTQLHTGGNLGLSAMGYGLAKNDLTWRFARVGLEMAESSGLSVDPVMWNLGSMVPLISNLWLSPHMVFREDEQIVLGILFGAVL